MLADFRVETEDESPREVSKELVSLHNELLTGNSNTIERLRQAMPAGVSKSMQQTVSLMPLEPGSFPSMATFTPYTSLASLYPTTRHFTSALGGGGGGALILPPALHRLAC